MIYFWWKRIHYRMIHSIFCNKVPLLQFFAVILWVEISMWSVHIMFYLTPISCDMLTKVKTTQTSHNNLLIPTCILSLLLSSTTSFPYSILPILAMIFHLALVSITLPSPGFTGNIVLTYKMSQLDILQSFLRLVLAMPNTSLPLCKISYILL